MKQEESTTVFEHIPADERVFVVTAAEPWSVAMVQRLKKQRPNEVNIRHTNKDGSLVAELPLDWMRIKPGKLVSEKQRETSRNNIMKARQLPQAQGENEPNLR